MIFTLKSRQPIFPNDIEVLQPLDIVRNTRSQPLPPVLSEVHALIAFDDGETGWIVVKPYADLPERFQSLLA